MLTYTSNRAPDITHHMGKLLRLVVIRLYSTMVTLQVIYLTGQCFTLGRYLLYLYLRYLITLSSDATRCRYLKGTYPYRTYLTLTFWRTFRFPESTSGSTRYDIPVSSNVAPEYSYRITVKCNTFAHQNICGHPHEVPWVFYWRAKTVFWNFRSTLTQ